MFDFHIHIARLPYAKQLIQSLLNRNYDFVTIACEPWEWKVVVELKKIFSTGLKPLKTAYGIHPMIAQQATKDMFAKLREILKEDKRTMVGEAGIDKRYPGYDDGTQDSVFLEQAKLALEFQRDLQIHCVGDYMRVLKLLEKAGYESAALTDRTQDPQSNRKLSRPIFHRFGGNLSVVKKALPYGTLFSLHADSFRKKSTAAAIPHIPQERVFFETDADETFAQRIVDRNVATSSATTDPGTESGMTSSKESVILTLAEGKDPVQFTPEECASELESRLESVRSAYAKSLE